ncbi:MAG: hypothetical protein EHM38_05330 [Geobacteraceae bacterium]|nr:MAG: hypothetical protein EHM38_05330 [Geobacteraceae bacterium]
MTSLVIHAPEYQLAREGTKSFHDTFKTGVGNAYALNRTILAQVLPEGIIHPGWRVVLSGKDKKRRAEGELVRLEPAIKDGRPWFTENGIRRFNVYIENLKVVPYRSEALNRNGVAVI